MAKSNLKIYNALYLAYADEIRNLWTRSVFLGVFMTLAWGGYGALKLKMIEANIKYLYIYHFASLGLCFVIIVLSLLWIAMAKGSKFVQEAHEWHIQNIKIDEVEKDIRKLFCDLDKFEHSKAKNKNNNADKINEELNPNLFFGNNLKAYRYSPSKINIALGGFSCFVGFILAMCHIIFALSFPMFKKYYLCFICYLLIAIFVIVLAVKYRSEKLITLKDLKGGSEMEVRLIEKIKKRNNIFCWVVIVLFLAIMGIYMYQSIESYI